MESKYREVAEGKFRGFLDDEEPSYLYIIKSAHKMSADESSRIYYVTYEDPYEPGLTRHMTKKEIKKDFNIDL